MGSFGRMSEFDKTKESWDSYTERLEFYFQANDIAEQAKKKAILLTMCGAETYKLISNLIMPKSPREESYENIVEAVKAHIDPTPSIALIRYKFHQTIRRPGETVSAYVNFLRQLAKNCEFENSLDDMLRDRLVCGINNEHIQKRLFAEPKLTFQKALQIALSEEAATKQTSDIHGNVSARVDVVRTTSQQKAPQKSRIPCYRCLGTSHSHEQCRFKESVCHFCSKKGHIQRACRNKKSSEFQRPQVRNSFQNSRGKSHTQKHRTSFVCDKSESSEEIESQSKVYELYSVRGPSMNSFTLNLEVNGHNLEFQVDTGASLSLINKHTYENLLGGNELEENHTTLQTYTGEKIKVLGEQNVTVKYSDQEHVLPLIVVEGKGPPLLGRNWLEKVRLNWAELQSNVLRCDSHPENLLQVHKYKQLFSDTPGRIRNQKGVIRISDEERPKFFKARPVPYAHRDKVAEELDRLEKEGTITKVDYSPWAAPIVPVLKKNGTLRICGDYRVTINSCILQDNYPIPTIEELLARLSGGIIFSKIDLTNAYLQVELDENSKKYTTINTHKGLYVYNRLPFGICSSPYIFQRCMDNILKGLAGTCCYFDDILVTGKSNEEHKQNLDRLLTRLEENNLRVKLEKCEFNKPSITYLGHYVDKHGVRPSAEKVIAVRNAPVPKNLSEVRAFIGMVSFYRKFIPNISATMEPLIMLTRKNSQFQWTSQQDKAFTEAKRLLITSPVLKHYDTKLPLVVHAMHLTMDLVLYYRT